MTLLVLKETGCSLSHGAMMTYATFIYAVISVPYENVITLEITL